MSVQVEMKQFKGTHGTNKKAAADIQKVNFNLTKGRLGRGAYFWRFGPLAIHLAEGWYAQCQSNGTYRYVIGDRKRAIITVEINCPVLEYLNLEDPDMKDGLAQLAIDKNLKYESDEEIAALHSLFIAELESELQTTINVIEIRLAPPMDQYVPQYSIKSFGAPIVYVVRKSQYIRVLNVA